MTLIIGTDFRFHLNTIKLHQTVIMLIFCNGIPSKVFTTRDRHRNKTRKSHQKLILHKIIIYFNSKSHSIRVIDELSISLNRHDLALFHGRKKGHQIVIAD